MIPPIRVYFPFLHTLNLLTNKRKVLGARTSKKNNGNSRLEIMADYENPDYEFFLNILKLSDLELSK